MLKKGGVPMLELYKNIRELRQEQGLTQAELAKRTGYSDKSMIAKIESGKIDLPLSKVEIFADALNTTPVELMGETWESDILDNARLDVIDAFDGDAYQIACLSEAEREDALSEHIDTLAAHHEGEDWTPEELNEIEEFKKFVRSKRKN